MLLILHMPRSQSSPRFVVVDQIYKFTNHTLEHRLPLDHSSRLTQLLPLVQIVVPERKLAVLFVQHQLRDLVGEKSVA